MEKGKIISNREDESLLKHHELYMNQVGGKISIEQMINLINYQDYRKDEALPLSSQWTSFKLKSKTPKFSRW